MSTYIIDLISHLTLCKIGLTRIKTLSPPMLSPYRILETLVTSTVHIIVLTQRCTVHRGLAAHPLPSQFVFKLVDALQVLKNKRLLDGSLKLVNLL